MCVIIDANCAHCITRGFENAKPIVDWITSQRGAVASGGKNLEELILGGLGDFLTENDRAGRLRVYPNEQIAAQEAIVAQTGHVSNDPHVIALVRTSGSRMVFTQDNDLKKDLRNRALVPARAGVGCMSYSRTTERAKLNQIVPCHAL